MLGGPGSGKGTQCEKLVAKYGFSHFSTGDLLRAEVASGSERGKKLDATMAAGELVTLDTVLELLRDSMMASASKGDAPGFLVDGFPRELEQAIRFEKDIRAPDAVLFFDVSEETMKARLLKRGQTSGRVDDNEETILKRFRTFEEHSKPVVKHYEPSGKLHQFHAESTPDEIFNQVSAAIDPLMKQ